jgi:hypothetical protein
MADANRIIPITSRAGFQTSLRDAFSEAAEKDCRQLWLCDTDFAGWPLGERGVIESLTRWARSQRRFTLLAERFDAVVRLHPRWVEWRRNWAHIVQCRTNDELEAGAMPTLLIAPGSFSLNLVDPLRFRGRLSREAADAVRDRELLDAVLQHSEESFPATTTGL